MKTQFILDILEIHQKCRPFLIHLQERVGKGLNKPIVQKSNIKLEKCSDKQLIRLIVITVKKNQTVKFALD